MKTITISTQKQFDKLPNSFREFTVINIENTKETISIDGARENSTVVAWDNSTVVAWGNSTVVARENSRVGARENSRVEAWGNSRVEAWDNSRVEARDNSTVEALENSRVEARNNSTVVAWGNSTVVAWDNSRVEAWDNSRVETRDNSRVEAWDNSRVEAWDNSRVEAWDNSRVEAWGNVGVYLISDYSVVTMFAFSVVWKLAEGKINKKAKTVTIVEPKYDKGLDAWLEREGVKNNKSVILYKKVSKDFLTQEGTRNETKWEVGKTVTHPSWRPKDDECGEGKFHACSRAYFCDEFRDEPGDRYVAIKIKKEDLFVWDNNPRYPHKIAFREGKVVYEVDRWGDKIDTQINN